MAFTDRTNLDVPTLVHVVSSIVTVTGDVEVDISGDYVQLQSGTIVISQISGQTLQLQSGTTVQLPVTQVVKISGEFVEIVSGQTIQLPSTQVVKISGETVYVTPPTGGKIGGLHQVTDNSGGTILTSGAVTSMTVKAKAGNAGEIYVGFSVAEHMPYSGFGFQLDGGDGWSLDIDDMGKMRVFGSVSGDFVTYGGVTR